MSISSFETPGAYEIVLTSMYASPTSPYPSISIPKLDPFKPWPPQAVELGTTLLIALQ